MEGEGKDTFSGEFPPEFDALHQQCKENKKVGIAVKQLYSNKGKRKC